MQFTQHAAMINYFSREADALVGLGIFPTIEIPSPPMAPINYSNQTVTISGGTVGALNFGNVHDIQVNLQTLTQNGSPGIAELLAKLTDVILNAQDANEATKNELLEQIASLTSLANSPQDQRKAGIVKAIFSAVKEGASAIGSVGGAWQAVEPILQQHFGL